jgi:hypothetical protein
MGAHMLRKVPAKFDMSFDRSGGSIVAARVDVWKAQGDEWIPVAEIEFEEPLKSSETVSSKLPKGQYTCIFKCFIEESLNGHYSFVFSVAGKKTFTGSGDVNVTTATDDKRVFRNQFILKVQ